jgi:hypothetical protein
LNLPLRRTISILFLATASVVAGGVLWRQVEISDRELRLAAYVDTLPETAYLKVSGVPLQLPLAAVNDYRRSGHAFTLDQVRAGEDREAARKNFREASASASAPLSVRKVTVVIYTWGWDDFGHHDLNQTICPALAREWARSICDNPWSALQQSLPGRFDLAEEGNLEPFQTSFFAGGNMTQADHLRNMILSADETQIACDPDHMMTGQNLCTAARRVGPGLLAIWIEKADVSAEDLQNAGDAVAALVKFGLGRDEHHDQLMNIACKARRSGHAKPFNDADKECPGD